MEKRIRCRISGRQLQKRWAPYAISDIEIATFISEFHLPAFYSSGATVTSGREYKDWRSSIFRMKRGPEPLPGMQEDPDPYPPFYDKLDTILFDTEDIEKFEQSYPERFDLIHNHYDENPLSGKERRLLGTLKQKNKGIPDIIEQAVRILYKCHQRRLKKPKYKITRAEFKKLLPVYHITHESAEYIWVAMRKHTDFTKGPGRRKPDESI